MADDMFKAVPVRFAGYGMAFGESLAYWNRRATNVCYIIGISFACTHPVACLVMDQDPAAALKACCWEILASLVFPTIVVFHITRFLHDNIMIDLAGIRQGRLLDFVPAVVGVTMCFVIQEGFDAFADSLISMVFG